jgi:hypothetical protein
LQATDYRFNKSRAVATDGSAPLKVPPLKSGGRSRVGEYVSSAQTRAPASKEIQNPRKAPAKTNFTISRSFTTRSANTSSGDGVTDHGEQQQKLKLQDV